MATPEELARMLQYGTDTYQSGRQQAQAPRHWLQALSGALQMGIGGHYSNQARYQEGQGRAEANKMLAQLLSGQGDPQAAMANPWAAKEARAWQAGASDRAFKEWQRENAKAKAPLERQALQAQIDAKRIAAENAALMRQMALGVTGGMGAPPQPGPPASPTMQAPTPAQPLPNAQRLNFGQAGRDLAGKGDVVPDMGPQAPAVSEQERRGLIVGTLGDPRLGKMIADVGATDRKLSVKESREALSAGSKEAQSARTQMNQLQVLERGLDMYNRGAKFGTGAMAPYEYAMRSFLRGLGVGDADTVAGADLARSVSNQLALIIRNPDSGMGLPGATSDRDINFLMSMNPGIANTPGGNAAMLEVARRLLGRKIRVQELRSQYYKTRKTLDGFDEFLGKYAEANPLFDDLRDNPVFGGGAQTAPQTQSGRGFKFLGAE